MSAITEQLAAHPCSLLGGVRTVDYARGLSSEGEVPASPRDVEFLYENEVPLASKDQSAVVTEALIAQECSLAFACCNIVQ